ncbi:MAG TPA: hypothetical protein VMT89_01935 [Candidatus Acidoferrales bacterium]|nr:hypothetical protein [Candidatus Acidoferrales bacterium]
MSAIYKWAAENIIMLVLCLIVVVVVGVFAYDVLHPSDKGAAATGTAVTAVHAGDTENAADAVGTVAGNAQHVSAIQDKVRAANVTIIHTEGASAPLSDALDSVGRQSVCMFSNAAELPDCVAMQRPHP